MQRKINYFKYNPVYSLIHWLYLKVFRRIQHPQGNIHKEVIFNDSQNFNIFFEIDLLDKNKKPKRGNAIFKVIFHSSVIPVDIIIKKTQLTIPFFSGLPGFCTKQFMVNKHERKFSGRYEWESVEMAQSYARSFALNFMKKTSKPLPVFYEIIDKSTNEVIESVMIENK